MAKKKKARSRRRQADPGVDVNEQRRQRLEARRQAKTEALEAQRRKEARDRLVRRLVYLALILFLFWFIVLRNVGGDGPIDGHEVLTFSTGGSGQHTDADVDYPTNPPVSGQHSGDQPSCGTFARAYPDELQVHALEHASVGILFAPDLDPAEIEQIESTVHSYDDKVFSAPQEGIDTPIAVTAWGKMMKLDSVDEKAIGDFIDRYRNGGDAPEVGSPCPASQSGSFVPDPSSTPEATTTPDVESTIPGD